MFWHFEFNVGIKYACMSISPFIVLALVATSGTLVLFAAAPILEQHYNSQLRKVFIFITLVSPHSWLSSVSYKQQVLCTQTETVFY